LKRKYQLIIILNFIIFSNLFAQNLDSENNYSNSTAATYNLPVPPKNERSLFYIQKSTNPNTIIYEGNLLPNGELDPDDPIKIFWIRYQEEGQIKKLSFFQKKMAYGIKTKLGKDGRHRVRLVSFKDRDIIVYKDTKGKLQALVEINGKIAKFKSAFLMIGKDFFIPEIKYLELFGENLVTGREVYERYFP